MLITEFTPESPTELIEAELKELREVDPNDFSILVRDMFTIDALRELYGQHKHDRMSEEKFIVKSLMTYLEEIREALGRKPT